MLENLGSNALFSSGLARQVSDAYFIIEEFYRKKG